MFSSLKKSIISTLAYFEIFNFPLTILEIKKNLFTLDAGTQNLVSLKDIQQVLNSDSLKQKINHKNGFYFLKYDVEGFDPFKGVEPLMTRQKRYYLAEKKFRRTKKLAWLLSKIPAIKMIAVCNSLSYNNADKNSDIDFFIVTAPNKIWLSRLLSVALIKLLNLRPKPNKVKNKICLSFFVDENNLNLKKFQINNDDSVDIYLVYWITQLVPIFDRGGVYDRFWQNNSWTTKWLPNRVKYKIVSRREVNGFKELSSEASELSSLKPSQPEKLAKKIQLKFLNKNLKSLMNKDTRVVINDKVLKLYTTDRRKEYLAQWLDKINKTC